MNLPKVIFGTSGLGNLYTAPSEEIKMQIVGECINNSSKPVVFDCAGKYGAGLALEALGKCLKAHNTDHNDVIISNKLGWLRTPLVTKEPTFEPGVWVDLKHDAVQQISYDGILACFEQGNQLLNGYNAQMVSVHDPDEYLAAADSFTDKERRYRDILEAYTALQELKSLGKVKSVGIGAKDWQVIKKLADDVELDWVMFANSMTVHSHSRPLTDFMKSLKSKGIKIINSAVFNGGFLTGSDYYNYQPVTRTHNALLYEWRDEFYAQCQTYNLKPAGVCVAFGLAAPGVTSIALNTTNPARVKQNIQMSELVVPAEFWKTLKRKKLIDKDYQII